MHGLLLFLGIVLGLTQQGKVILQTGVAEVEFYLDGTLVALTDVKGRLMMENFPAGSFRYELRKRGYKLKAGTFSIGEGETRILEIELEKSETRPPAADLPQPRRQPAAIKATQPPASPAMPVQTDVAPAQEDGGSAAIGWILGFVLMASGAGGIWYWKHRAPAAVVPLPEIGEPEETVPRTEPAKPAPEFIEQLRRKEEMINAGFIDAEPGGPGRPTMKDKEVVIVLPKEAYHFEEE